MSVSVFSSCSLNSLYFSISDIYKNINRELGCCQTKMPPQRGGITYYTDHFSDNLEFIIFSTSESSASACRRLSVVFLRISWHSPARDTSLAIRSRACV